MTPRFLYTFIFVITGVTTQAQTAIGKRTVDGNSAILDFASGSTNGIILPAVTTLPASPANGTFLLDKNDRRVKMRQNGAWVNLSDQGSTSAIIANPATETANRTVMGSRSSNADGVLVLESSDKALILPKINSPHLNVKSPYPGMMCYDTTSQSMAIFDGFAWSYWK